MLTKLIIKKENLIKQAVNQSYPLLYSFTKYLKFTDTVYTALDGRFPEQIELIKEASNEDILGSLKWYSRKDKRLNSSYHYLLLDSTLVEQIEIIPLINKIEPILDKLKYRYYIDTTDKIVYIHYPEFTLVNSQEETQQITDLVILIELKDEAIDEIMGNRYSFSQEEFRVGFRHSHLQTNFNNFSNFCFGSSSAIEKFITKLQSYCSEDDFELLLVQLEEYLKWESLEGKPHYSISNFYTVPGDNEQNSYLGATTLDKIAKLWLKKLNVNQIIKAGNSYFYDPGLSSSQSYRIEIEVTNEVIAQEYNAIVYLDYDEVKKRYITNQDLQEEEIGAITDMFNCSEAKTVLSKFNIEPRVYKSTPKFVTNPTVKRLGSNQLKIAIENINILLNNHTNVDGENNNN